MDVAVNFMKKISADAPFREFAGLATAEYMYKYHSHEVAGKAIAARLIKIHEMQK